MESNFKKSESITNIAKAMITFQEKIKAIKKSEMGHYNHKYATLDSILEAIKAPMKEAKLSFVQMPSGDNCLVTVLMHETGEFFESTVKMAPKQNDPQGQGSAITYMRRYALSAILGIATEDDDDGNAASGIKPGDKPGATKENPLFKKAVDNINKAASADVEAFKKKLEKSDKYSAEEKAQLVKICDERIAALDLNAS